MAPRPSMDAADRDYETSVGAAPGRAHIEEGDNSPPTIPGQATILASSWVFTLSSVFLFLEFLFLYEGPAQGLYYNSTGTATSASWVTTPLINWCGAISCVGWFVGFALLIDWIVFHTFPVFGPSRRALTGAILKLIAAAFFNVQPWSQIIDDKYGLPEVGVPWSNFVGIVFFHAGNCIDAVGMYPMFDKTVCCTHLQMLSSEPGAFLVAKSSHYWDVDVLRSHMVPCDRRRHGVLGLSSPAWT